jgi:hypothetical protein
LIIKPGRKDLWFLSRHGNLFQNFHNRQTAFYILVSGEAYGISLFNFMLLSL